MSSAEFLGRVEAKPKPDEDIPIVGIRVARPDLQHSPSSTDPLNRCPLVASQPRRALYRVVVPRPSPTQQLHELPRSENARSAVAPEREQVRLVTGHQVVGACRFRDSEEEVVVRIR